jgi:excisionase family DNA binding protein
MSQCSTASPAFNDLPGIKPLAVTVADACRITGLGNTTIYALIREGKLRTFKAGRRRLVVYASLEALVSPEAA